MCTRPETGRTISAESCKHATVDDLEEAIAAAVWAWRRAEQALEDYEVPGVDDLSARNGRYLDKLKADVEAHRHAVVDLAGDRLGRKTYDVAVERNQRWLVVRVPEIDCVTQAKRPATVEYMARDLIAAWLEIAADSFDVRLHSRVRGLPARSEPASRQG